MQIYTDGGWRIYCSRFFVSYKYIILNQHYKRGKATTKINRERISKRALSKFQYAFETRNFDQAVSSYYLKTPLCLLLITWCAQEKVYISEHKAKELVGLQPVRRRISLPRNTSPGVNGEGRGREKICHPKQLTPRGVEKSPTGISTNDMKGRATNAIKKLWTSKPSGKNGGKGKSIKLIHGKEEPSCNSGKELIWSRLAVSLGWCKSVSWAKRSGWVKLILWVETMQPAKVPRDVLSHHDCPLSTSVSRASDPQLYSSSLQPRTHIICAVAWKTYCGVIQLDSRDCSIAQSSVSTIKGYC